MPTSQVTPIDSEPFPVLFCAPSQFTLRLSLCLSLPVWPFLRRPKRQPRIVPPSGSVGQKGGFGRKVEGRARISVTAMLRDLDITPSGDGRGH